ncbi:hypothetical protein BDZ91DRAFT_737666 [Kalaharituber pfeilii]|nr:hypothetical protein BDZ91DRAFT_737666 [Kalaharituber pfeilii]
MGFDTMWDCRVFTYRTREKKEKKEARERGERVLFELMCVYMRVYCFYGTLHDFFTIVYSITLISFPPHPHLLLVMI